jgi:hypothetical protein
MEAVLVYFLLGASSVAVVIFLVLSSLKID